MVSRSGLRVTVTAPTGVQFRVNAVNRAHRDTSQRRRNCGRQIHGKTAQNLPEFLLADSGTAVVPIFNIHLKKLTRFNKCLAS